MKWLRLYHDAPNDPKWRLVAAESGQCEGLVLAVWMHMMVCASAADDRGRLEGWDDRVVAASMGVKCGVVTSIREAMQGVVLDGDVLTGWDKRQRVGDDAAAKKRKQREQAGRTPPDGGGKSGNGTVRDKPRQNGHVPGQYDDVPGQNANVPRHSQECPGTVPKCPETPLYLYSSANPITLNKSGGGDAGARAGAREAAQRVAELTGLPASERNLRTVERWLGAGYDPERDIVPAVAAAVSSAKDEIGFFEYFSKAIKRRHDRRMAPPAPEPAASNVTQFPRSSGGGRPIEAGAAEFLALLARKKAEMS